MGISTDGIVQACCYSPDIWSWFGLSSIGKISFDEWYFIAATYDRTVFKIYINGELDNSKNVSYMPYLNNFPLVIGRACGGDPCLFRPNSPSINGTLDEVAIYNRALTPEEIQQHYQNGLNGLGYCISDLCPDDPNKTEPGICGCGVPDTDSDGDGVADCNDLCPNDPNKIEPGICGCGVSDTDFDGDGTPNCIDGCPLDPNKIDPGICGCSVSDTDSDADGLADCNDGCPYDPNKSDPGICGCGVSDIDSDGDGVADCNDLCPNDPNKIAPGVCGCGAPDTDSDGDGVADCIDNCLTEPNRDQKDSDGDGIGDQCEAPPVVHPDLTANPNPAALNTPVVLTATVDDSATGNSNIASAEYSLDGSTWLPMNAADGSFNSSVENVTATIASLSTGVYEICVRGTDATGKTSEAVCFLMAVYDPSGGFVTGGGWINSPAGAYTADPLLTGKATFGFVSKYQKGAKVPTGQTEFQFKLADLNFKSTSYEWLVVAGAKAQYKGSGTINGMGDYSFMLTAIDGQVSGGGGTDKFRIKIWDKATDSIVYDNQMEASDTSDPTTVIGGGSIVVHKQ